MHQVCVCVCVCAHGAQYPTCGMMPCVVQPVCVPLCQLRKHYECAVEDRNSHGLSLLERNEELILQGTLVCMMYCNVQAVMLYSTHATWQMYR